MTMARIFAGGVGLAMLATAAPAAAQYYYPVRIGTQAAVDRCAAAVQNRLSYRNSYGGYGRVVSVTSVNPNRNSIRVRGIASSGRMAYGPFGIGAFGALGANYRPDLSFACTVDYRGRVRDVDLNRRY